MLVHEATTFSDFLFGMQTSKCHTACILDQSPSFYFILFYWLLQKCNIFHDINYVL